MKTRSMRYWDSDYVLLLSGWRRLGLPSEGKLGRELDREELELMRNWKAKPVKRIED